MNMNNMNEINTLLDPSIFKAYDIRGIFEKNLTPEVALIIGKAIATKAIAIQQNTICVGFDGRKSSPILAEYLINGITSLGLNVINIGMVPTPLTYFTTFNTPQHLINLGINCTSSVMITGSHNPPQYNGFKIVINNKTLYGEDITHLYDIALSNSNSNAPISDIKLGEIFHHNIFNEYKNIILGDIKLAKTLKIAVDCGNGVAGKFAPQLLRELGCEVTELYCEVDGNFPNHHPDPAVPENLHDLINCVKKEKCDLGLAFDGDGDRLGVVTANGEIIYPDRQLILFAQDVLQRNPNAKIIYDVKCTANLAPAIKKAGGIPIMYKTGHSIIKSYMQKENALLGGEMSGHIFFKERWFGFDDGLYAACRLLEIVSKYNEPSIILEQLPNSFCTPEIHINLENKGILPVKIVEQFKQYVKDNINQFMDGNINYIDGVRVDYSYGFGLIRASNTTPMVVMRFEGSDENSLNKIRELFNSCLDKIMQNMQVNG